MTKLNYLLECLAEECAEVQHIKSKIIRFGIDDIHPETKIENRSQIVSELIDLVAVMNLFLDEDQESRELYEKTVVQGIQNKEKKLRMFMAYSISKGILDD